MRVCQSAEEEEWTDAEEDVERAAADGGVCQVEWTGAERVNGGGWRRDDESLLGWIIRHARGLFCRVLLLLMNSA